MHTELYLVQMITQEKITENKRDSSL